MNIEGNPISGSSDLENGGSINGDLSVNGELKINDYVLPTVDGNLNDVITNNGDGTSSWKPGGGGGGSQTLQETYDLSAVPQITTTIANPVFEVQGQTKLQNLDVGNYSMPSLDGTPNQILITNGLGDLSFQDIPPSGSGDVSGPALSVNENITSFNGVTGKLIKDSGINTTEIYEKKQDLDLQNNGIKSVSFSENSKQLPSLLELSLCEWNYDLVNPANIVPITASKADFLTFPGSRFITSKEYIVPNFLSVGGFVSWEIQMTNVAAGNYAIGISSVTDGQQFEGFGSFNSVNNSYLFVNTQVNAIITRGEYGPPATPNTDPVNQTFTITFTRVSSVLWELSFIASTVGAITQKIQFGLEESGKFYHPLAGVLVVGNSSLDIELKGFASSGYDPEEYIYVNQQDEGNKLQCLDAGGNVIYSASPNDYFIGKLLVTNNNIKPNTNIFVDSCVRCNFVNLYKSSFNLTGTTLTNIMNPANYLRVFGSTSIPTLSPGVLYNFNMHGRLSTGALTANNILNLELRIGTVVVATSASVALEPNLVSSDFDINWQLGSSSTFFSTNSVFLDVLGAYMQYGSNQLSGSQPANLLQIRELPGNIFVPEKNSGDMGIYASWSGTGNSLTVEVCTGQYSGYTL